MITSNNSNLLLKIMAFTKFDFHTLLHIKLGKEMVQTKCATVVHVIDISRFVTKCPVPI